jgi:hypothetical protein
MHLTYRLLVAALAFTGSVSLAASGELNPLFALPGVAMIPGYYRYLRGLRPANRWVIAGLALVELLVVAFDTLMVSGDFLIAVAHMSIVFQALKSFDLREPWDPLQVYFMALLQLVITSELTLSISMGAAFVVFLFIFMAAMVFSHFMKEGTLDRVRFQRPLIAISLVALLATIVFFVSLPRFKAGIWGRRDTGGVSMVGFSEEVDFGSFGEVLEDGRIAMRVELSGGRLPLYWRGATLDEFNGVAWKNTLKGRTRIRRTGGRFNILPSGGRELSVQNIIVEPMDTDVVFGLGEIAAVKARGWVLDRDESGAVFLPVKNQRRFSYTVYSVAGSERAAGYAQKHLGLPEGMEEIGRLAREVSSGGATARARADLIESHLRDNYEYSLKTEPPLEGMTPVEDFLFSSRKGYCEHYATAMALMLRAVGIPSRLVTGFSGGEINDDGDYVIVRQSNAHSWVEAAIDGRWRRFDPTPPAIPPEAPFLARAFDSLKMNWYRYVVGFSTLDQKRMLMSFSPPKLKLSKTGQGKFAIRPLYVSLAVGAVVVMLAFYMLRIFGRGRPSFETRLYLGLRKKIRKKGGRIGPSSTAREALREARRLSVDGGRAEELIRMYEEARFGGKAMGAEDMRRYEGLFRQPLKISFYCKGLQSRHTSSSG